MKLLVVLLFKNLSNKFLLFRALPAFVLLMVMSSCASTPPVAPSTPANSGQATELSANASIEKVIDGDTVIVNIGGSRENVRLIGIDTPESVSRSHPIQCYGIEASDYLASLLPEGSAVTLILDVEARDQYDRLLAYVIRSADDLFVNHEMVKLGYADTLSYPPNTHYETLFDNAARHAAQLQLGLWGVCGGPDVPLE